MDPNREYLIALSGDALAVLKRTGHKLSETLPYEGTRVTVSHPAHPVTTRLFGEPSFCVQDAATGDPVPFVVPRSCLEVMDG